MDGSTSEGGAVEEEAEVAADPADINRARYAYGGGFILVWGLEMDLGCKFEMVVWFYSYV